MDKYGYVKINLENVIKERGITKNKLSFRSELQRTQINKMCQNAVARIDLGTLARLCYALDCDVTDLLEYVKPEDQGESVS